jgi:predicted Zn finger-like uncharacterized protein
MLIVCPSCATSYQVDPASLGGSGRSVRCARCRTVWFAVPATAEAGAQQQDTGPVQETAEAPGDVRMQEDWGSYTPWTEAQAASGDVEPAWGVDAGGDASPGAALGRESEFGLVDAPPLAPMEPGQADQAGEGIGSFAARRMRLYAQRRLEVRKHGLLALIAVMLAIEVALISWRTEVVALLPQTASFFGAIGLPVNLRGLALERVRSTKDAQDGVTILAVEGTIVNTVRRAIEVPRLRFVIRDRAGHEIYTWTALPTRPVLGPGESLPFNAHLASPPPDSRDLVVRFFNRRDASATIR